ncbi:DUF3263 domain-containing protein [Rhodococcus opacus]|jgi:hypothetical protein|uniref:DUF3263 domain-containing protein n=1 Tax=Rhodococcus opacus TaxID=37919 RepID=UPI00294918B2|nr:DUF3263 domain-containing protein [Rhodococcus opacus]MDV6248057.1 DUF3263 domain-containing protein [Rhodococcus opacus]
MMREDQDLLDFAIRWVPYGGARREDILVNFGMTPAQFRIRIHQILISQAAAKQIDAHDRENLEVTYPLAGQGPSQRSPRSSVQPSGTAAPARQ